MKKFIVATLVFALMLVLTFLAVKAAFQPTINLDDYEVITYTVKKGDTMWALGSKYKCENDDMREWIDEVKELNNCTSNLQIGQRLKIYSAKEGN